MKFNDTFITTLAGFTQVFSFSEFWQKRLLFIRDCSPKQLFYSDKQKRLYEIVCSSLIEDTATSPQEQSFVSSVNENEAARLETALCKNNMRSKWIGIVALYTLVGRTNLDFGAIYASLKIVEVDLHDRIGYLAGAKKFELSAFTGNFPDGGTIEVCILCNTSNRSVDISLGSRQTVTLQQNECIGVTHIDGKGISFLPRTGENAFFTLELLYLNGVPTLVKTTKQSRYVEEFPSVACCAAIRDNYLYISCNNVYFDSYVGNVSNEIPQFAADEVPIAIRTCLTQESKWAILTSRGRVYSNVAILNGRSDVLAIEITDNTIHLIQSL